MPDYRPTGGPGGYEFDEVAPAGMGIDTSVAAVIADGGLGGASVFNVTAYGATGDGVTDDRLAITAAMAAANAIGGGVVYFPAGTYIVSRDATNSYSLDLPGNNITLLGECHLSWIKHPTGMPNSSVVILRCLGRENIVIDSMGFDGNWGCEVGVDDTNDGLNHTTQRDPKNYGLMLRSTVNAIVRNCSFTQLYGDAIWVGSGGAAEYSTGATNTRIRDCDIDITARDGIALAQKCEGISIKGCRITNTYSSPFDTEPGDQPVRDVVLEDCYLGRWWNAANFDRSGNTILTICGGKSTIPSATNYARNYRVRNNTIFGAVLIQDASDILFDGNRVICDWDGHSYAPITVTMYAENIRITNNYVYDRTTVAPGGGILHDAAIQVQVYPAGAYNGQPSNVLVAHNQVDVRNTRIGIKVDGTGALAYGTGAIVPGVTGSAETITVSTLQDTAAAWTVNQWRGYFVRCGSAVASVSSNTADTLTLWGESNGGAPGDMPAWTNPLGESADTPANGSTYIIYGESGIVEVLDNHIDCSDDGYGGGSYGIKVGSFRSGQRSRVRGNNIKNAGTAAIRVQFVDAARKQLHLEITDNVAWDDQLTPTCTTVLSFSGTPAYDKLILRGNTGDAAMTHVSGLTTGTWLIADGAVSQWAGFGSPESVVVAAIGSTYVRLDGSTSTTLYVKTATSTLSTGWTAK